MPAHPLLPDFIITQHALGQRQGALEGATQFVDISGFTALTEALMQHGKEGAEVLGEALRFNFNPLVDAVEEAGGWITGFAGDAFTAVYPDHPDRPVAAHALQAARKMQAFFAEHVTIANRYGQFAFAVKVGLSWGQVEWEILDSPAVSGFTAADPPTYLVCGPGIDGCADAEKHAKSGQILLDEAFAARLSSPTLQDVSPGYFQDQGTDTTSLPALPQPAVTGDGESLIPHEIALFPKTGEFRRVAVVFLSFDNVPSLPTFAHTLQRTLRRYGGTFTRFDFGDKGGNCLFFFGAPTAHENNEERALDFISEVSADHKESGIQLRAGVTQNIMYVGFNGGENRHEFACLGRAVTMAARLMMKAQWGEIWCDERVHKRTENLYAFDDLGPWPLKGFAEPQPLFALAHRMRDSQIHFSAIAMIGREGELRQLLEPMHKALAGEFAGLIYVDGEAGMGKSYLVATGQKQLERAHDGQFQWLYAPTNQTLRSSLHPFAYALRVWAQQHLNASPAENLEAFEAALAALQTTLSHELSEEVERLSSFLAALVGHIIPGSLYEQLEPRFRFANTRQAISTWLHALSTQSPILLQIEDGHWLDEASIELLQHIAQEATSWPLAVLLTNRYQDDGTPFRIELGDETPTAEINLNQLSRAGLTSLATSQLGEEPHPTLLDLLQDKAHGNPFFVEQILGFLQDQQMLRHTPEGLAPIETGVILPEGVTSVLIARLDRLSSPVKQVVQVASALGREFEVPILTHMLHHQDQAQLASAERVGPGAAESWIEGAQDAQIWSDVGNLRYLFLHALMRDAAYDMQARARLRTLHKRAGAAYEALYQDDLRPHFGQLAYHFEQAQDIELAAKYLERAGEAAKSDYRNLEALDYHQRLLRCLPPKGEDTRAAYLSIAEVLQVLQRIDEGLEACDKAEAALDTPAPAVHYQRAFLTQMQGGFDNARELIQEALTLAQAQDDLAWQARCLNSLGVLCLYSGDIDQASGYFQRSLALAKAADLPQIQAKAISNMAGVAMARKELDETRQHLEESIALARSIKDRWTEFLSLGNLGELDLQMERPQDALEHLQQAIATGHEIGTTNANFMANYGESMRRLGQLDAAQTALQEAEDSARSTGNTRHIIDVLYAQSKLAQDQSNIDRAHSALTEAISLAQSAKQAALLDKLTLALEALGAPPTQPHH